jgi:hypothetical protein
VAPVNGVAVADSTYRATSRIFEFEPLTAASVKGKTVPVRLWRAKAARSRFSSDITRRFTAPLVGRELEKALLVGTFERAVQPRMAFKLSSAPFVSTDSWKSECRVEASILIVTS